MAFLLAFAFLAAPAAAQTFPELTSRVVDQANIIPDDREAAMTLQLEQLQRATSRQLVVVTVTSLEGHEIQDYAYQLGRHWGIGQSEANNGVVLLVAPNERRVWIAVGYGLEGILTDALSSRIVNEQILPRFREGDYAGGIEVGAAALVSQLAAPPEAAEQRAIEAERARDSVDARDGEGGGAMEWILIIVVLGVVGFSVVGGVLGGLGVGSGRRYRRGRASPWGRDYDRDGDSGLGWFIAGAVLDAALRGGRSGGSSWGSGGSSWGSDSSWGGGGGFSGGGGSFGGGGAGGSW